MLLTVAARGMEGAVPGALILPELLYYDLFLQAVFVRALVDILRRRRQAGPRAAGEVTLVNLLAGILLPSSVLSTPWFATPSFCSSRSTSLIYVAHHRQAHPLARARYF